MANPDLNTIIQGVEKNSIIDLLVKLFGKLFPNKLTLNKISESDGDITFAGKKLITNIPENVSAFNNDAGYLTSHQSLNDYYTKAEVELIIQEVIQNFVTSEALNNYYTKNEINDIINNSTEENTLEDNPIEENPDLDNETNQDIEKSE